MLISGFVVFRYYKKEKKAAIIEIDNLVQDKLQGVMDSLGEVFEGIFTQPTVKKAFSIIGSQGGQAKAEAGLVDDIAKDVLNGPQFAAIKMGASSLLGIDVDGYIEEKGAMQTLGAMQQIAGMLGIDINQVVSGQLGNIGGSLAAPGNNPYINGGR